MELAHYFLGTGEHGVGIGKREYLYEELGEGTVELMKTIKRAIDPLSLFNPGKVGNFNHPPNPRSQSSFSAIP
jgi:D-lactate dehydrogenase (cytochrome)